MKISTKCLGANSLTKWISILFLVSGTAHAVPTYVTVEGEVTNIFQNGGDTEATDAGFTIGKEVSYTFLFDMDADGTETTTSGTTTRVDALPTSDFYFADFLSGDVLAAGYENDIENNFGILSNPNPSSLYTNIYIDNQLRIYDSAGRPDQWIIGESLYGYDYWGTSGSYIYSSLTITGLRGGDSNSVPAPAPLALLAMGVGVLLLRRQKRN